MVQYRHEIEAFISGRGKDTACDGSGVGSGLPVRGRENQVAGGAESPAAVPLYCAGGACERILPGGVRKKKELAAVQSLVAHGSTVKDACRVAGIPRCTYYRALKPSAKAESDAELVRLMCDIENDRHISSTYGIERLTGEVNNRLLKAEPGLMARILRNGTRVNRKRVHRLMKEHGIHSRIRRRKHPANYYKAVGEMLKKNRAPNTDHGRHLHSMQRPEVHLCQSASGSFQPRGRVVQHQRRELGGIRQTHAHGIAAGGPQGRLDPQRPGLGVLV